MAKTVKKETRNTLRDLIGIGIMHLTPEQEKGLLDSATLTLNSIKERAMLDNVWDARLANDLQNMFKFLTTTIEVYNTTLKVASIHEGINRDITKRIKKENGKGKVSKRK